jgi:predicted nucleotidyltransferase
MRIALPGRQSPISDLQTLEQELAQLLEHPVDLVPAAGLKPLIRDEVLAHSREIYAA